MCIAPVACYFGLDRFEQKESRFAFGKNKEYDSVVYEITKFVRLMLQQNPNVLCLLWLEQDGYIHVAPEGKKLIENRDLFSSKEAYHSFTGYASAQLHRMTHGSHEGFMGEKRQQLIQKFGYDTKNATHLIRLLRMGIEFLTDGQLRVYREDARELISIKKGEWPMEKIRAEAERLVKLAQEAFAKSPLPARPDRGAVQHMLIDLISGYFRRRHLAPFDAYLGSS